MCLCVCSFMCDHVIEAFWLLHGKRCTRSKGYFFFFRCCCWQWIFYFSAFILIRKDGIQAEDMRKQKTTSTRKMRTIRRRVEGCHWPAMLRAQGNRGRENSMYNGRKDEDEDEDEDDRRRAKTSAYSNKICIKYGFVSVRKMTHYSALVLLRRKREEWREKKQGKEMEEE